jgi:hypothetical protein
VRGQRQDRRLQAAAARTQSISAEPTEPAGSAVRSLLQLLRDAIDAADHRPKRPGADTMPERTQRKIAKLIATIRNALTELEAIYERQAK